jgi:phenylpyruvate tautomerase PptA (4-oxalocrotonate tautomerase family)
MPLVTLTTTKGTPSAIIDGLLEAVHNSLVSVGVPQADKFHRVIQLEPGALRVDPVYPDLKTARSERFVLIEITLSVGRPLKLKRQIAEGVVAAAAKLGVSGEDVMIVLNETRWENWSFGGGRNRVDTSSIWQPCASHKFRDSRHLFEIVERPIPEVAGVVDKVTLEGKTNHYYK